MSFSHFEKKNCLVAYFTQPNVLPRPTFRNRRFVFILCASTLISVILAFLVVFRVHVVDMGTFIGAQSRWESYAKGDGFKRSPCNLDWSLSNNIWMIETARKEYLASQIVCTIESFATKAPNSCVRFVVLHSQHQRDMFEEEFKQTTGKIVSNVHFIHLTLSEILASVKNVRNIADLVEKSKFKLTHVGDIFRLVVLYKYGGLYADTDVFAVRNFSSFGQKFLTRNAAPLAEGAYANAVLALPRADSLLYKILKSSFEAYSGSEYANLMAKLLSIIHEWCEDDNVKNEPSEDNICYDLTIKAVNDSNCSVEHDFKAMETIQCTFYHYTKTYLCFGAQPGKTTVINLNSPNDTFALIARKHCPNTVQFYRNFTFVCQGV